MYKLLRPLIFTQDPEFCHDYATKVGVVMGKHVLTRDLLHTAYGFEHPLLRTSIGTIPIKNPIGLAAGFDKNAMLYPVLASLGFGFVELGSITAKSCPGNPKPRLWRHPELKSIRVNYGLMNDGVEAILPRIQQERQRSCVLGASIAQTNKILTEKESLQDYVTSYEKLGKSADYITLNMSCPNVNKECFDVQNKVYIGKLLRKIDSMHHLPTFIKLGTTISPDEMVEIGKVAAKHTWIQGFVLTNLFKKEGMKGGMSGLAVQKISNERIKIFHREFKQRFTIIGCGGVFTGKDALAKIEAGASAIQLITALIYEGPSAVKSIKKQLVREMQKKKYKNIEEAVGKLA